MRNNLILLLLLTGMLNSLGVFGQAVANSNDPQTSIDDFIENSMKQSGIVGMGASIIINKQLVWSKAYGLSDKENNIPFSTSTIMNIASISKTFTGVCIMKAVEDGIVTLDEDINTYLDFKVVNPYFPEEKVTLRHLATHTSSLADRYPFYSDSTYCYNGAKPEELGRFLKDYFVQGGRHYSKDNFLNAKPGTSRDYSNTAAGLAGYIIELKTGKKLNEYAKTHIFKPLKMQNSGWSLNEIDVTKHSKLYEKKGGIINQIPLYEVTTYPEGGVRTSVKELSKFFISLLNDGKYKKSRILKEETVAEMLRYQYTELKKPDNVNLSEVNQGIFWSTKANTTKIGHNGSDPGVRTFMLSDLKKEIAIVIFFNTSLPDEEEITYLQIYDALYKHGVDLKVSH